MSTHFYPNLPFEKKPEKFSKISYLKKRWGISSLTLNQLKRYNKWSSLERYKLILIELELEHYLTTNITIDLGKRYLFSEEESLFTKKTLENEYFHHVKQKLEMSRKDGIVSPSDLKELTFGQKILIWSGLNKNIFKNKFMEKANHKKLPIALNNLRKIRNGIAHMNSREQIESKMSKLVINDECDILNEEIKELRKDKNKNKEKIKKKLKDLKNIYYKNSFMIFHKKKKIGGKENE